jgi:hypothetical protein
LHMLHFLTLYASHTSAASTLFLERCRWVTEGPLTFLKLVFTEMCTVLFGVQR